jgi:uncharacterized protein YegL
MTNKDNFPTRSTDANIARKTSASEITGLRNVALSPTSYSARVTRNSPCAIVILIDQSQSMSVEMTPGVSRANVVTDIVNDMLENLIIRCQRDSIVREYFDVLVIGYGKPQGQKKVDFAWEGNLKGRKWVNISELKENVHDTKVIATQKRMPWGLVPSTEKKKIWINPSSTGINTPMFEALGVCHDEIQLWAEEHPESFPPLIFNVSDGYPTDIKTYEQLIESCAAIKKVGTTDGKAILFNCLVTDGKEMILPSHGATLGFEDNDFHMSLYEGSSFLPHELKRTASEIFADERLLLGQSKTLILNSTASALINLLTIGTKTILANAVD